MNDVERLEQLIQGGYPCISIVTREEQYALEILRQAVLGLNRCLWIWSLAGGVKEGLLAESPFIADTETPGAGLTYMASAKPGSICATLDLAEHLKCGGKALRILRDMITQFDKTGITVVMIDHADAVPEVIRAYARPFEISFPDEHELLAIIRETLQRQNRNKSIEVGVTQRGLQTIVRNLRGLTRRQAARIISDTVADDRRFDDDDINVVIASKR
ncbi:MAG: hypothetical protein JSU70_22640, partial [Phycisphaerales bacterium]